MLSERIQILKVYTVWFHLCKILETWTYSDRKQINGCLGIGEEDEIKCKGAQENLWGWWKCSVSCLWWWINEHIHVKTQQITHFQNGQLIVCQLSCNKVIKNWIIFLNNKINWHLFMCLSEENKDNETVLLVMQTSTQLISTPYMISIIIHSCNKELRKH